MMQTYYEEQDAHDQEYAYHGLTRCPDSVFAVYGACFRTGLDIRLLTNRGWFTRDEPLQDLLRHVVVDLRMGKLVNVEAWDLRKHLELLVAQHTEGKMWHAEQEAQLEAEQKAEWDAVREAYRLEDLEADRKATAALMADREVDMSWITTTNAFSDFIWFEI